MINKFIKPLRNTKESEYKPLSSFVITLEYHCG